MDDHEACNLIALSVGSIMRHSLDDDFKGECKKLLQVTNTKMAEEILYKKLMETIQTQSCGSVQSNPAAAITPLTSSADQGELQRSKNTSCATIRNTAISMKSSTVVTSPQRASSSTQRNVTLGEMYCRMIQVKKRSLSPQPEKSGPLFTVKKEKPNSVPF